MAGQWIYSRQQLFWIVITAILRYINQQMNVMRTFHDEDCCLIGTCALCSLVEVNRSLLNVGLTLICIILTVGFASSRSRIKKSSVCVTNWLDTAEVGVNICAFFTSRLNVSLFSCSDCFIPKETCLDTNYIEDSKTQNPSGCHGENFLPLRMDLELFCCYLSQ